MGKNRRRRAARRMADNWHVGPTGTVVTPAYVACQPTVWVPDLDNAHLKDAALGLTSIGDPYHRPPAPIHP